MNANGSQIWADVSSTYSFEQITAKSTIERWELSSNQTGLITKPILENSTYIHQLLVNASFVVIGGGTGFTSPKLSFEDLGANLGLTLPANQTAYWMDFGSKWSVPSSLNGSVVGERWVATNSNTTGLVGSQSPIITYETQYFVVVNSNAPSAGTISALQGWFNSSQSVSVTASANNGWKLAMWATNGQFSSNGNSTTFQVNGPTNETAMFSAGLIINSAANGHVDYNYGTTSGTVASSSSDTVYVSPGTNVLLNASPDSAFYSAGDWSIGNDSSTSSSKNIVVSAPTTVGASFGFNIGLIGIIAGVLVGIVVAVAVLIVRRGGSNQLSDNTGHGWKW
jgi:hypothetical protein